MFPITAIASYYGAQELAWESFFLLSVCFSISHTNYPLQSVLCVCTDIHTVHSIEEASLISIITQWSLRVINHIDVMIRLYVMTHQHCAVGKSGV